jgi:hypothetical protein
MAKDEFKNLGFQEPDPPAQQQQQQPEKGQKGELRW